MPSPAQRAELAAPFKAWVNNNPATECNIPNGRRHGQLLEHVKSFYFANYSKNPTEPQLKAIVGRLLSHHRPGIIRPDKTNKGYIQKRVGAPSAHSKVESKSSNKKHNKKNNEKRKDINDAENRKIIEDQGLGQDMRSKTETDGLCKHLLYEKKYPILGNQAMSKAIETNSHAIYIGTTKRALTEEDLRWLTKRGAQDQRGSRSGLVVYTGQRTRPVLLKTDGKVITMKEARSQFGAKSVVISYSRLRLNETDLEDALQTKLQPKLLGLERLHRYVDMGAKNAAKATEEMKDPNFLAKTFMTCLPVTRHRNKRRPEWVEFNNKRAKVNY
jgi:hypothetical protein